MRQPTFEEIKKYYEFAVRQQVIQIVNEFLNSGDNFGKPYRSAKTYALHGSWESDDQGGSYFSLSSVTGLTTEGEEYGMGYGYDDNDWLIDALYSAAKSLSDEYADVVYGEIETPPINLQVIE